MKRAYKIQTIVKKVKKDDVDQRNTGQDDIWRQKHDGELLGQVDNDSVSQFTTDSNGKPQKKPKNPLKKLFKKDKSQD